MYRNVYYDNREQVIHLWTWDELGKPIKVESSYEPYLYIESSHFCDATSIFNTSLKKVKFKNQFERNKFLKDTPIKRIFHNLSCEQEFLLSTYKDEVGKPESLINPLKVFWLDIETYSPDEFPHPEIAKDPRFRKAKDILKIAKDLKISAQTIENFTEAFNEIEINFNNQKTVILICGSLYFASEFLIANQQI